MMKQILSAVFIAAIYLSPAFAMGKDGEDPFVTRYVKVKKPVKKIIIYGDADVVFTNDQSSEILIKEKAGSSRAVKIIDGQGLMEIKSREYYRGRKPVIHISAQYLEALEMHGDGSINSLVAFKGAELNVFINGDCKIHICSTGKINIDASPDYTLDYKKNSVTKSGALVF